jgi:RHS repeat-associated protein
MQNYCEKLGIGPGSDPERVRQLVNLRIREIQPLLNSTDKKVREAAEEELRELFEVRRTNSERTKKTPEDKLEAAMGRETNPDRIRRPANFIHLNGRATSHVRDEIRNTTKAVDSVLGITSFQYDLLDRLVKVIYQHVGTISYTYDAIGNREGIAYPNGETIRYTYYPNNWLREVISGSNKTTFEYDKVGRLVKKALPNGVVVTHTYSASGRLTDLRATDAHNSLLYASSYQRDPIGNCLVHEIQTNASTKLVRCCYDPLYRLIEVKGSDGSIFKYQYDRLGNRLLTRYSLPSGKESVINRLGESLAHLGFGLRRIKYTYDTRGFLMKANDVEFVYDEEGNIVEKQNNGNTVRYVYDGENRLIKVQYSGGAESCFQYDALGNRVYKKDRDGAVRYYAYDGHNLIVELTDRRQAVASYTHDLGIDRPISVTTDGKTFYYLYDRVGSVIALTDAEGKVVCEYEYDVWGTVLKEVETLHQPFRFIGRELDKDSGLYYLRRRYYDPSLGRYISQSPSPGNPTNPQSLNKYSYALNNPVTLTDHSGIEPTKCN